MNRKKDDWFARQLQEFGKKGEFALALHFQHQMMIEEFKNSQEMEKLKAEITQDVLDQIKIQIISTVRQELDQLFLDYKI